jgi:hypothetical protein
MQSATPDFFSGSHDAVIRVYDEAGNVIETHEHAGDFKELVSSLSFQRLSTRNTRPLFTP